MATPLRPAGVKTFGKETWTFVPAIADKTAPTVTELTDVAALHLHGFIYAEGTEGVTVSTNKPTAPRRVLDTETYETLGTTTYSMGTTLYSVDPQAASGSDAKKAYETLTEGTTGFLVRRFGIDGDSETAAGNFVSVFPVEFGVQPDVKTSADEAGEVAIQQPTAITDRPVFLVEVAAAA